MRSHPGIFTSQTQQWDPEELFGLTNPDRNRVTCSAIAVTRHRRCLRYQCAMDTAARMLEDMATMDPLSAAKSERLYSIASQSVCWQHGGQVNDVYCKWKSALQALGTSRKVLPSPRSPPVHIKTEPDSEESVRWVTSQTTQRGYSQAEVNILMEEMKRMKEELENMKREKERDAAEQRRKQEEEERLKREKEENAKRQREEEEERKQKEHERKERERKERENKEREERINERARKRAQEREEAARKARKEWTDAWEEYLDGWEYLKGKTCREAAPIMIPWPVKSGKWEDVTIDNVKAFFQKAPPMTADSKEEKFRLMSQENKRWHTDKIMSLFGSEIISGKYGKALSLVAKLMIQLRQEAQKARKD